MKEPYIEKPDYGNWVSRRLIDIPGLIGAFLLIVFLLLISIYTPEPTRLLVEFCFLSILLAIGVAGVILIGLQFYLPVIVIGALGFSLLGVTIIPIFLAVSAQLSIMMSIYFAYARFKFSPRGGNVQARILELVLERFDWDGRGKALDIGCGNAALAVKVAKKFPKSRVTGVDYWGSNWEYSRSVCEENSRIEGVSDRVDFKKASASSLPFENESFDAAVSNLVFHEVKDADDKRNVIKEALRILKKGGQFAFQDLFLIKRIYGEIDDLMKLMRSWGIRDVNFLDTSRSSFIPRPLRISFMVGTMGILCGRK
jgi:SAM-dependent methyltransferase